MSTFEIPEFIRTNGALTYGEGPDGERLGDGFHSYEVLSGLDVEGNIVSMLVGVLGAAKVILSPQTFQELVGSRDGDVSQSYWEYTVENATLYGHRSQVTAELGSWPPTDIAGNEEQ